MMRRRAELPPFFWSNLRKVLSCCRLLGGEPDGRPRLWTRLLQVIGTATGSLMSITAPPQPNHSRDLAIAAIERAHREIGLRSEEPMRLAETGFRPERETKAARLLAEEPRRTPPPARDASLGKPVLWSFMGALVLVGAGAAGFVWQKAAERPALDPISTATVSTAKRELPPPAPTVVTARTETALAQPSPSQTETTPQVAAPVGSTAPTIASDQAQSVQMMARELASARESIDQLKAVQAQLVRDNAELTEHLKSAQETARLTTDLAEDLKLTRAQMARDNADFAERLKVNQEQMAKLTEQLKAGQEQIARLVASEQKPQQSEQRPQQTEAKPRPRTVTLARPPVAGAVRKPPSPAAAAASPQARLQTHQPPRRLPPKPQPPQSQ